MPDQWYYTERGQQMGPVSTEELQHYAATGRLQQDALVWKDGLPKWVPARSVGEFALQEAPAEEPIPFAQPVAAPDYARERRPTDRYDDDDEDRPRRRPRRPAAGGMSTGAKVAIGLAIGGGVLVLLIAVIVIIVIANQRPNNERTFNIPAGGTQVYEASLKAGIRTVVTVRSDRDTDIDLFIFAPGNILPIAVDERFDKNCIIEFIPPVTGQYRLEVRNINKGGIMPIGPNRCILRWEQR